MRKYLFGTGIIPAVVSGISLLRSARDEQFTWRTALAWLSWGITLALAIGALVDISRASRGRGIDADSPVAPRADALLRRRIED